MFAHLLALAFSLHLLLELPWLNCCCDFVLGALKPYFLRAWLSGGSLSFVIWKTGRRESEKERTKEAQSCETIVWLSFAARECKSWFVSSWQPLVWRLKLSTTVCRDKYATVFFLYLVQTLFSKWKTCVFLSPSYTFDVSWSEPFLKGLFFCFLSTNMQHSIRCESCMIFYYGSLFCTEESSGKRLFSAQFLALLTAWLLFPSGAFLPVCFKRFICFVVLEFVFILVTVFLSGLFIWMWGEIVSLVAIYVGVIFVIVFFFNNATVMDKIVCQTIF